MAVQIEKDGIVKGSDELGEDHIYKVAGFQFDSQRIYQDYLELIANLGIEKSKQGQLNVHVRSAAIEEGLSPVELLSDFAGSLALIKNNVRNVYENEFDTIHPSIVGTYTEQVINEIKNMSFAQVGRVRFLMLSPKTCYSMHKDPDWYRLHIPLKTNEKAFFIVDEKYFTMPEEGSLYVIHPQEFHLAANSSLTESRLHLVFDTAEEMQFY